MPTLSIRKPAPITTTAFLKITRIRKMSMIRKFRRKRMKMMRWMVMRNIKIIR